SGSSSGGSRRQLLLRTPRGLQPQRILAIPTTHRRGLDLNRIAEPPPQRTTAARKHVGIATALGRDVYRWLRFIGLGVVVAGRRRILVARVGIEARRGVIIQHIFMKMSTVSAPQRRAPTRDGALRLLVVDEDIVLSAMLEAPFLRVTRLVEVV